MEAKKVFRQQRQVSLKVQASEKEGREKVEVSWADGQCRSEDDQQVGPDAPET